MTGLEKALVDNEGAGSGQRRSREKKMEENAGMTRGLGRENRTPREKERKIISLTEEKWSG